MTIELEYTPKNWVSKNGRIPFNGSAPVHRYTAYMDQWEAEIDTALFFKHELGEYDKIEGVSDCIRCFIAATILPIFAEQVTLLLLIGTASATR